MSKFEKIEDLKIANGIIPFPVNEQLEFKRIFKNDNVYHYLKDLVEIANTQGGCFVFGVKSNGIYAAIEGLKSIDILGFNNFEKTYPAIFDKEFVGDLNLSFQIKEIDGKTLAFVFVQESQKGVVCIKDGMIYYREGNRARKKLPLHNEYDAEIDIKRHIRFREINQTPSYASLKNYFVQNEYVKHQSIYKYMSIDSFIHCLNDGDILFQEPNGWDDQYESRYYKADYKNLNTTPDSTLKLFAACFTKEKDCEASWKVYSNNSNGLKSRCIQLEIDARALREQLDFSACKGKNDNKLKCKVYEGQVSYRLNEKEISDFHKKDSPYHDFFFESFNLMHFIGLLLYKRPAYEYEKEIRFFMIPDMASERSKGRKAEKLKVTVSWKELIKSVRVDKRCSESEIAALEAVCEKYGIVLDKKLKKAKLIKNNKKEILKVPLKIFNIDKMHGRKRISIE